MITPLSLADFYALSPLLILLGGALLVVLLETFFPKESRALFIPVTLLTLIGAFIAVIYAPASAHPLLTPWLAFDAISKFFALFFLAVGIATVLLSNSFFHTFHPSQGEFFFLLLSTLFGLLLIGAAADFLTLFIGLEILSIALYVLCGYMKKWNSSREAATKYFLMGALATSFLLYGIAFFYGATGTTQLGELLAKYRGISEGPAHSYFLLGVGFVTLGLSFKAAIVPFHTWAPDVYCGSSTPITAFMSVATKAGAFAAFVRVFMLALPEFNPIWNQMIALLAIPTLIYANAVAILQTQMRRFFAYSGIAHAGLLMLPLAAGGPEAVPSLLFYLIVYGLATLGAFAVISTLDTKEEGVTLEDLRGLFKRSPLHALLLSLSLLTLAGIPPTVGFLAKFYVFKVAFEAKYYALVVIGLLMTILGAYYYLRIIALMLVKTPIEVDRPQRSIAAMAVAWACLIGIIGLSIYPQPILDKISSLTTSIIQKV